jgi:voltage-gated potassium channel Kch
LFRATCTRPGDALNAGSVLTAAGEFAFVLLPFGVALGVLGADKQSLLAAIAAVTMLLGPPVATLTEALVRRLVTPDAREADDFDGVRGSVLLIGFGRFGQIVSQCLLAERVDVTAIDNDAQMIQVAGRFGFKVYYGDGTRLDVLRAAGGAKVRMIVVCIDNRAAATRIVELCRADFPGVRLYVRSFDRQHTLELIGKGVDYELRETYESAMIFGRQALVGLGLDAERATEIAEEVRRRDLARLALQQAEGIMAGVNLLPYGSLQQEPLTEPERVGVPLNPEAQDIISHETEFSG